MKKVSIVPQTGKISFDKASTLLKENQNRYRELNGTSVVLMGYEDGEEVEVTCTGQCIESAVMGSKSELNLFVLTEEKVRFRADADILPKLYAGCKVWVVKGSIAGGQAFATFKELSGTQDTAKTVNVEDTTKTA